MALVSHLTRVAPFHLKESVGVVATTALPAGSIVLACTPASLLLDSADVCARCMQGGRGERLQRCTVCKTAYCSRACQSADWAEHRSECKRLGWLQSYLK